MSKVRDISIGFFNIINTFMAVKRPKGVFHEENQSFNC